MHDDVLNPGDRLGRYDLIRPVASGGMATVWAARLAGTRGFNKIVAVKTLLPTYRTEPDAERMFVHEASLTARVRHPNVVEVLDLGEDRGLVYIVMEWISGEPLTTIMRTLSGRAVPLDMAVGVVSQVCAGLHAAHELTDDEGNPFDLVHRDVSPHNVLLGFNGVVKIVDFGIAKSYAEQSERTAPGALKGKLAYMAPEQLRFERIDRRTDVFATGILLYMLTTGKHPFRSDDQRDTVRAILSKESAPSPGSLMSGFPPRLERVVMTALAKNPRDRFPTAAALGAALLDAVRDEGRVGDLGDMGAFVRRLLPERVRFHENLRRQANELDEGLASVPSIIVKKASGQSNSTLRAVAVSHSPATSIAPQSALSDALPTLPPRTRRRRTGVYVGVATAVSVLLGIAIGSQSFDPRAPTAAGRPVPLEGAEAKPVRPGGFEKPAAEPSSVSASPAPTTLPQPSAEPVVTARPLDPALRRAQRSTGAPGAPRLPAGSARSGLKDPYADAK